MIQLTKHPRFTIAQKVKYLVLTGQAEYFLDAIVIGSSLDGDTYSYSIKLNGGFIISPVPETALTVGMPTATAFQHSNN